MGHSVAENGVRLALGGVQNRRDLASALRTVAGILEE